MKNNLYEFKKTMFKNNLDALIISDVSNITYLTGYAGFSKEEREAYLFISKNNHYIITDGRYTGAVSNVPDFTLMEIAGNNSRHETLTNLVKKHKSQKIGVEENNLSSIEYKSLKKLLKNIKHFDTTGLRTIKNNGEIHAIQKSCNLGDKTFTYILSKIKTGITEKELAFEIEFFIKKAGADISFKPIVAFGKNAAIPHHQTSDQRLKTNNYVLLDFGAKVENYCSDMTRTVFLGIATSEQKLMYQTVLDAQQKAIDYLYSSREQSESRRKFSIISNNKIRAKDVDKIARDYIISKGYPSIPHSLGHGTGLDIHEHPSISPESKDILKPGMVFSIEPGIYIPGLGGVRIEDLVILEKSGPRLLTHSPKHLIEI